MLLEAEGLFQLGGNSTDAALLAIRELVQHEPRVFKGEYERVSKPVQRAIAGRNRENKMSAFLLLPLLCSKIPNFHCSRDLSSKGSNSEPIVSQS